MQVTLNHHDGTSLVVTNVYASKDPDDLGNILVTVVEMPDDAEPGRWPHLSWPSLAIHTTPDGLRGLAEHLLAKADEAASLVADRRAEGEASSIGEGVARLYGGAA